jgi:two-component system, response regulator PdtaR
MAASAPASRRILIVEDEAVIAWELQFLLEELGHHVCGIAANEDDAERLAWQTQPS